MGIRLDKTDFRILATLEQEGRIQNQQLAERVLLSPGACSQRFQRLVKAKLIKGFHAEVDLRRLCNAVSIFAVVQLAEQGSLKQNQFLKALEQIPEVVDCFEVAGNADFIVKFDCANLEDYHGRVNDLLSDLNYGVRKIESHIVLRHVGALRRTNLLHLMSANRLF